MQLLTPVTSRISPLASAIAQGWRCLALVSLALGSVMAVVLVLAKTPLLASALGIDRLFPVALVYHVNLTILLWVHGVAVLLWQRCFVGCSQAVDGIGLLLSGAGVVALLLPLGLRPQAVLSNYVPVIDSSLFVLGLAGFLGGVGLQLLNRLPALLNCLWSPPRDALWLLALAGLVWSVAVLVLLLAGWELGPLSIAVQSEWLFWGFGHIVQALNLLLMLAIATALVGARYSYFAARMVQFFMLSALLAALLVAVSFPPQAIDYRNLFTAWMRYFSLPLLLALLWPLWRASRTANADAGMAVRCMVLLVLAGAVVGAGIRADNLLVPAHYHAMTGALNLMLMCVFYRTGEALRLSLFQRRQLQTYVAGVVMMVAGLALSGWLGVGRKLAGDAQGLSGAVHHFAWMLMGVGGALALAGCFLFLSIQWRYRRNPGVDTAQRAGWVE